ncbi:hypothetical protein ACIP2X_37665 [Streptomyces sp. NPDC089424]|uniref:hypothetical protein n=1 Tax=Streptomyces sp. NPDC089424 TaxID=3365917 RepID=UPI0037FCFDAE
MPDSSRFPGLVFPLLFLLALVVVPLVLWLNAHVARARTSERKPDSGHQTPRP